MTADNAHTISGLIDMYRFFHDCFRPERSCSFLKWRYTPNRCMHQNIGGLARVAYSLIRRTSLTKKWRSSSSQTESPRSIVTFAYLFRLCRRISSVLCSTGLSGDFFASMTRMETGFWVTTSLTRSNTSLSGSTFRPKTSLF